MARNPSLSECLVSTQANDYVECIAEKQKPQASYCLRWSGGRAPRVIFAPTFVPRLFHLYTLAPLYLRLRSLDAPTRVCYWTLVVHERPVVYSFTGPTNPSQKPATHSAIGMRRTQMGLLNGDYCTVLPQIRIKLRLSRAPSMCEKELPTLTGFEPVLPP